MADLVEDGVNGYTPPAGDVNALATVLEDLVVEEPPHALSPKTASTRMSTAAAGLFLLV